MEDQKKNRIHTSKKPPYLTHIRPNRPISSNSFFLTSPGILLPSSSILGTLLNSSTSSFVNSLPLYHALNKKPTPKIERKTFIRRLDSISCVDEPEPRALAPVELRSEEDGSLPSFGWDEGSKSRLGRLLNTWDWD
jgi:hypothetical protein